MAITLHPDTQQLIENQLKQGGFNNADDMIRTALEVLGRFDADDLDESTWGGIDRAEAQHDRGEGIPVDDAFARLRLKHFGN